MGVRAPEGVLKSRFMVKGAVKDGDFIKLGFHSIRGMPRMGRVRD